MLDCTNTNMIEMANSESFLKKKNVENLILNKTSGKKNSTETTIVKQNTGEIHHKMGPENFPNFFSFATEYGNLQEDAFWRVVGMLFIIV